MKGRVIFTDDREYELSRIIEFSQGYLRKYYVCGKNFHDLDFFTRNLTDFSFLDIKDTFDAKHSTMFSGNTLSDFFVIKHPRLNDILDKNIGMYQTVLKGFKLVVDNHPFLDKKDVYWSYFLWSFFDKSLLGYPHCYAFQRAKVTNGIDPYDCSMVARKVKSVTETTINKIFSNDIKVDRITLSNNIKDIYQEKKKELFETETRPWIIVRKLKQFINDQVPHLRNGLSLINPGKVHDQYKKGERLLVVSDAKVDIFLESELWKYINNVNLFMETLNNEHQA